MTKPIFTTNELAQLQERFASLDKQSLGYLSETDLLTIPELFLNPLAPRILSLIFTSPYLSFDSFVSFLAIFAPAQNTDVKLRFAFSVFDADGDGYVTKDDLMVVLRLMMSKCTEEAQIERVARMTIDDIDGDGDGRLSYLEFKGALFDIEPLSIAL